MSATTIAGPAGRARSRRHLPIPTGIRQPSTFGQTVISGPTAHAFQECAPAGNHHAVALDCSTLYMHQHAQLARMVGAMGSDRQVRAGIFPDSPAFFPQKLDTCDHGNHRRTAMLRARTGALPMAWSAAGTAILSVTYLSRAATGQRPDVDRRNGRSGRL